MVMFNIFIYFVNDELETSTVFNFQTGFVFYTLDNLNSFITDKTMSERLRKHF